MLDNQIVIQAVFFVALLLTASVFDLKKRIIPDSINLAIVVTAMWNFTPVNLLGIFSALPFLISAIFMGGMGGGDIKFMAACGLVLGLNGGIQATIIGLLSMLLYAGIYNTIQKLRKSEGERSFPLAPFLSIGCIAAYLMEFGG